jgi:hypothetical protein
MNEEYLWSKKGGDPEIEKLETLLSDFRFKEGSPPDVLTCNIVEVKPRFGRRFAWLSVFGATATAAVLVGMYVVRVPEARVAVNETPQVPTLTADKPLKTPPTEFTKAAEPDAEQLPTLKTLRTPRIVKTVYRTQEGNRVAAAKIAHKPKLTREEKYAYDRLMLALSITSSKLKVVQETIDRKADLDQRSIRNDK